MSFWDQFQTIKEPESNVETDVAVMEPQQNVPQSQPNVQSTPQNDFWNQFQPIETQETNLESFKRQAKGAITRGLGQIAGLPGDIESLGRSLIPGVSQENVLPTSEKIMQTRKELHPELEPKNRQEAIAQEILGDYILQPGGPLKKLAISAAQTLAKEVTKDLGGNEKVQAGAKIITGILASRAGKPNVKDFINKEYNAASRSIPKNDTINAKRAAVYLDQVEDKIKKGALPNWKEKILGQVKHLKSNIKDDKIKVVALDESVKDINKLLTQTDIKKDREAIMWLTRIKQATQHELKQYGKKNPEFWQHYKVANASFAGYKQSLIAQRQIEKFKDSGLFKGSVGILAESIINPALAAKTIGTLSSLYGIKKAGELTHRIFSNPVLASYYMKTIASAAKDNAPQTIANLAKLDAELKKTNPQSSHSKQS